MTTARRRLLLVTLAVSLLLAIGPGPVAAAPVGTATATASSSVWPPDPARPFSDPVWLPLRDPARVSCTYRNCTDSGGAYYHGYWAVDFLGERGDPIHPAGAGVLHVGAVDGSCRTGTTESSGTWVWIDHGGGVVTKYNHLDSVTPGLDGQLVTPETQIGTMGHSGDHAPCVTDYLHFEVRTGGVTGPRVDPGRLWGCRGTSRVAFPDSWGATSWNDLEKAQEWTPAHDDG